MPPKPKFTKEEMVAKALRIVEEQGASTLTARELGKALGSSTRPIFTVFSGMEELQEAVCAAAMKCFEGYAATAVEGMPIFKSIGMKMVMFGMEKPELYKLLFMSERGSFSSLDGMLTRLGTTADVCISAICESYDLTADEARVLFENVWIYTFGIGALCASGACKLTKQQLSDMLTTEFKAVMLLIASERNS